MKQDIVTLSEKLNELAPIDFDTFTRYPAPIGILPPVTQEFALATARETQTALDANFMAALSIFSIALAGKFYLNSPWEERNNLYTMVVAGSGERKSATFSKYAAPIIDLEKQSIREGQDIKWISDDITMERLPRTMLENNETAAILSAEGGILETAAGRYGNNPNIDILLKSFNWEMLRIERANKETITLMEPCLTVGLFMQPTLLHRLPERFIERGLLGRFLFSFPSPMRGTREINPPKTDPHLVERYHRLIQTMALFVPREKMVLHLSDEASNLFTDFCREFERRQAMNGELSDDSISSWTERFPGQIIRIASLIYMVEQAEVGPLVEETINGEIPVTVLERVIDGADYFIEHAKIAFGLARSDRGLEDAKYLLKYFERQGKGIISRTDVWRSSKGRFQQSPMLDRALSILEDRDYLIRTLDDSKTGRGRKGEVIILHKSIFPETYSPAIPKKRVAAVEQSIESITQKVKEQVDATFSVPFEN